MTAIPSFGRTKGKEDVVVLGKELTKDTTSTAHFKNYLIAPKGEWQCGISVIYADFASSNSDYMMLLQGIDAQASMLRLAPQAAYTYSENKSIGVRFKYTNLTGMIDAASIDLLGNFGLSLENINATSRGLSAEIFHRTYWGLDKNGRVGLFWDYILGLTRNNTSYEADAPVPSYTLTNKAHLGFAPGLIYFPMNNVSVQASLCFADLSYENVKAHKDADVVGQRHAWKAQASLNVLDLNFGLTIHF